MTDSNQNSLSPKIVSFAMRKGGVCRTTSTFNISYAAALRGLKVLMVDLDSQHNLTDIITELPEGTKTIYDALAEADDLAKYVLPTSHENLFLVPGDSAMSTFDFALGEIEPIHRFQLLKNFFMRSEGLKNFDLVTLDMGPSMNGTMISALVASTHYISPIRCDSIDSINGLQLLFDEMAQEVYDENPTLDFVGAFFVDFDDRKLVPRAILKQVKEQLGDKVFPQIIKTNTNFQKARSSRQSIFEQEPPSANPKFTRGREDILNLTDAILERMGFNAKQNTNNLTRRAANE